MPKFVDLAATARADLAKAKKWANLHTMAACAACFGAGFLVHALLF